MEDAAEREEEGRGVSTKGTLRPLADSISVQEVEKAAKQVQQAIAQQQEGLDRMKRYSADYTSLSNLVRELPDTVSQPIMVPFGTAAFFPGRLIHTNEFLVLLGASHYAERSAKQTVEIIGRQSKSLDGKISDMQAQIADLEAEYSFVTNTAEEAKAGLVEIREEYMGSRELRVNKDSTSRITASGASSEPHAVSQVGDAPDVAAPSSSSSRVTAEDREHDLLMARLSELELAEAAAGDDDEGSQEDDSDGANAGVSMPFRSNLQREVVSRKERDLVEEDYDSEEMEEEDNQLGNSDDEEDYEEDAQRSSDEEIGREDDDTQTWNLGDKQREELIKGKPLSRFAREFNSEKGALTSQHANQKVTSLQEQLLKRKPQSAASQEISSGKPEKPEVMRGFNDLQKELQEWRSDGASRKEKQATEIKTNDSSNKEHSGVQPFVEPAAADLKAFTGKVTEHSNAEPTIPSDQQVQESQLSRPMSRFKMRQAQAGRR